MFLELEENKQNKASESQIKLLTYYNYFSALGHCFRSEGLGNTKNLIEAVANLPRNRAISRGRVLTQEEVKKSQNSLLHSWNTQILLAQLRDMGMPDEFFQIVLPWLPTMHYYAFYHAAVGYMYAAGKQAPDSHTETLKTLANEVDRFPGFLSATCKAMYPDLIFSYYNSTDSDVKSVSNLARSGDANCHLLVAKMLRTTRQDILEDRIFPNLRKRYKVKNLNAARKESGDKSLPPTSVFHFLYRMRTRFNYSEAQFIYDAEKQRVSPRQICGAFNFAYQGILRPVEWLACKYLGKNLTLDTLTNLEQGLKNQFAQPQIEKLRDRVEFFIKNF